MITVIFGQPHSGKTTLAGEIYDSITFESITYGFHIDGDDLREIFNNKDYSREGRIKNLNRASDIATFLHYQGYHVIMSIVYPYKETRDYLNNLVPDVKWVYLTYNEIRGRENFHVTDFDEPEMENFLQVNTTNMNMYECIKIIKNYAKL